MAKKPTHTPPASEGGKARAAKLTAEARKAIAIAAAEKRWGKSLPVAEHPGTLKLGELEFPCAVLSDGTRVLTETDFMAGMGMYRSGALSVRREPKEAGRARTPLFLAFRNLEPFVNKHLGDVHNATLRYRTLTGNLASGIKAEIIPKICDIWLDARKESQLGTRQQAVAANAEILMRALAHVGIVALVDEATGYQNVRARNALEKILEQFIAKELRKWVKTFPDEYYRELFRLLGWTFDSTTGARPGYVGKLTNDFVYGRLAPGVLAELQRTTARDGKGRLKHHFHRRLTDDVGNPKLREHLAAVIALMKACDSFGEFRLKIDRALPAYNQTLLLDLKEPVPGPNDA